MSLRPLASARGSICVLALDHRDAMRNAFRRVGIEDVDERTMLETKLRIADAIGPAASTLLLDAAAVPSCRREGAGVLVPLEEQGHEALEGGRLNRLLEEFGPGDAASLGVQGCKLLLYYRADHPATAERQRALVEKAAADCHRHGLLLIVEPLVYGLQGESESALAAAFDDLVVAAARDLAKSGADLLKVQYPGSEAACERVTEAASPLPWTLLGGSEVDGQSFAGQLRLACGAGASGFIAGRAIWGGALALHADEQRDWLDSNARPLFEGLAGIADTHARRIP